MWSESEFLKKMGTKIKCKCSTQLATSPCPGEEQEGKGLGFVFHAFFLLCYLAPQRLRLYICAALLSAWPPVRKHSFYCGLPMVDTHGRVLMLMKMMKAPLAQRDLACLCHH